MVSRNLKRSTCSGLCIPLVFPAVPHKTDKTIFVNWIKGHSGNKLHECADRHAARAACRPINGPSRTPNESKYPYALYFYECLITGDVRKHVNKCVKRSTSESGQTRGPKVC